MSLSPHEIQTLADALAERMMSRLVGRVDADAWVDVHGAAELLGCSVPTVERLTRSGELPSSKFGRLRRYRRADSLQREKTKHDSAIVRTDDESERDRQLLDDVADAINRALRVLSGIAKRKGAANERPFTTLGKESY